MGHTGEALGADCVDLWEAGRYELKPLGEIFRGAAKNLDGATAGLDNLYRDSALGGPYGPVREAWSELREVAFGILRTTAENLELTGDALVLAATEYLRADQAAKAKFAALQPAVIEAHEGPHQGRSR